ncbi:peptidoglycan DD-metalloendopeptidase family protein [Paenibacillus sp. 1P07SE]|uniref:peptidoglycan DD-metalloendopeptidase family protein n=1 Tax=Paenibacillus sp. 1P07SE TaxID=3132209 RepID=UPI0039A7486C
MNEENKTNPKDQESPKTTPGGSTASATSWRRLLAKKWFSPAAFMAAAAIIVTLMWLYQGTGQLEVTDSTEPGQEITEGSEIAEQPGQIDEETLEVLAGNETMQWPVLNMEELVIATPFYEADASNEERQAAVVQVGNTFTAHMGIDFTSPDEQPFEVLAAMSGKVSHVEQHPTNGFVVEISHPESIVTIYQGLSDVNVKTGDEVKQGTIIAKSGRNELEKDLGNHLHFEIRQNGEAINPQILMPE